MASVDLNIYLGGQNVHEKVPVLPCLLRHLLFPNAYKGRDGEAGATTSDQSIEYYLKVREDLLEPTLDQFAGFLISPEFNEERIELGLKAIRSEYQESISGDGATIVHVLKALSRSDHLSSDFTCKFFDSFKTNHTELKSEVKDMLVKFYREHCSANIMKLVLQGNQSLDQLQRMVVEKFSVIPNHSVQIPAWTEIAIKPIYLQKLVQVRAKRDAQLTIRWEILGYVDFEYQKSLIIRKGKGSLVDYLCKEGLASGLVAGFGSYGHNLTIFEIGVELEKIGPKNIDHIITAIFQYLKMIRDAGPQEWYFFECKNSKESDFQLSANDRVSSRALASKLQYCEPKKVRYGFQMDHYDSNKIDGATEMLRNNNFVALLIRDQYIEGAQEESSSKAKYKVTNLSLELLSSLASVSSNLAFEFPEHNRYVPDKFDVKMARVDDPKVKPDLIFGKKKIKFWFKQDDTWETPTASIRFLLETPRAMSNVGDYLKTKLFLELFQLAMLPIIEVAEMGNLDFSIKQYDRGLRFTFSGCDQKLSQYMVDILNELLYFTPTNGGKFQSLKNGYRKELEEELSGMNQPLVQLESLRRALKEGHMWPSEILKGLSKVTLESISEFASELFSEGNLRVLAHGNYTEMEGREILKILQGIFSGMKPLEREDVFNPRGIALNPQQSIIISSCLIKNRKSGVLIILQTGNSHDIKTNLLTRLFSSIFGEKSKYSLRVPIHSGYSYFKVSHLFTGTLAGLQFRVTGPSDPVHLDWEIEDFLRTMLTSFLEEMQTTEFEKHLQTVILPYERRPINQGDESEYYWEQIWGGWWNFDHDSRTIECLKGLTKEDLLEFIRDRVLDRATERRKFSIHVWGQGSKWRRPNAYINLDPKVSVFENPRDINGFSYFPRPENQ